MNESGARRIDVFFYGLFMDEDLLREKGIDPRDRRLASVDNFRLVIGARASLVPLAGGKVHGLVYSLTHQEIDALYSDSSVSLYRPEAIIARLEDGDVVPALCFNLPTSPSDEEGNQEYALKLRSLATKIGLHREHASSIE